MRFCFICGAPFVCRHREPELVAIYCREARELYLATKAMTQAKELFRKAG